MSYTPLSLKMAWQLAAPHTWAAAIMPVCVIAAAVSARTGTLSVTLSCALLLICILMQSAVNTFNDYFDFVKGADSVDDNVEPSDAVLLYNNINPKAALALAVGFLVVAFALGIYVIVRAGWIPLAIACVGAVIVVLYSGGKTPISYLPISELVSGVAFGSLIPLASYQVLTGELDWIALVFGLPTVVGVALIMLTNNSCDIEKDIRANRRTLSVMVGREKARRLYHALMGIWIALIVLIVAIWFTPGAVVLPFMLLASYPFLSVLAKNPLLPRTRIAAMSQICTVNVVLGAFYAAALFASSGITLAL